MQFMGKQIKTFSVYSAFRSPQRSFGICVPLMALIAPKLFWDTNAWISISNGLFSPPPPLLVKGKQRHYECLAHPKNHSGMFSQKISSQTN